MCNHNLYYFLWHSSDCHQLYNHNLYYFLWHSSDCHQLCNHNLYYFLWHSSDCHQLYNHNLYYFLWHSSDCHQLYNLNLNYFLWHSSDCHQLYNLNLNYFLWNSSDCHQLYNHNLYYFLWNSSDCHQLYNHNLYYFLWHSSDCHQLCNHNLNYFLWHSSDCHQLCNLNLNNFFFSHLLETLSDFSKLKPFQPGQAELFAQYLDKLMGFSRWLIKFWAATWDFQQCGMCNQQSLRSACAYAQSDQRLCKSLEYSINFKLLTEHHLEFLRLKGGCTCSSESILVKMPHCWKSRRSSICSQLASSGSLKRTGLCHVQGFRLRYVAFTHWTSVPLCILGNFSCSCCGLQSFLKTFNKNFNSNTVKWFESRSGWTLCLSLSGSKLFVNIINYQQTTKVAARQK